MELHVLRSFGRELAEIGGFSKLAGARQDDATTTNNMVDLARRQSAARWIVPTALATAAPGALLGAAIGGSRSGQFGRGALLGGAATGWLGAHQAGMAHARAKAYGAGQDAAKTAALTPAARADLPGKDFAVKAKKSNTGKEAYPIPDRQHASSALGFAKMHGDSADLAAVRAKIKAKFPDMLKAAMPFFTKSVANELVKSGALKDLDWNKAYEGFKGEVGPALGAIGGATLAGAAGKNPLSGAAMGYGVGAMPEMIWGKGHKT
jgi:hypothetical protein